MDTSLSDLQQQQKQHWPGPSSVEWFLLMQYQLPSHKDRTSDEKHITPPSTQTSLKSPQTLQDWAGNSLPGCCHFQP